MSGNHISPGSPDIDLITTHAPPPVGKEVLDDSGELVCTKPFPSMPTHFWNDDDGIKYTKAYFTKFQGVCVWVCGCVRTCVCGLEGL